MYGWCDGLGRGVRREKEGGGGSTGVDPSPTMQALARVLTLRASCLQPSRVYYHLSPSGGVTIIFLTVDELVEAERGG